MSGITYEIQSRNLKIYKHNLDYNFCKRKYKEYAFMKLDEFTKCLNDPIKLGEIGHLSSFVYWIKNKERHEYRETFGDYGLTHLLFHCLMGEEEVKKHAKYIHQLFKEDIKLV